jgi:hypothetical protein
VVGPSGWQVTLVAVLEIGVTAALTAAAANWVILRRAGRRRSASLPVPGTDDDEDTGPIPVVVMPGVVDETDDADGHRIYLNPWAAWDQDEPEDE